MNHTAIVLVAAFLASHAIAQDAAPSAPTPSPASPLAGPKVEVPAKPRTIVHKDMQGTLERLEERPETAALALLKLTDAERTASDKVLAARAALVSSTLYDNMALFLKAQGARQSGGESREARESIRELRTVIAPLLEPTLAANIEGALAEPNRAEFRRLITEYHEALAEAPAPDGRAAPGGVRNTPRALETSLTIREMARTLAATVDERRERTDALLKAINATPEQESKISAILRNPDREPGKPPTAEERGQIIRRIMDLLTPEQRKAATEHLRGR